MPSFPYAADRHALTLCASLVQNPMNLGALCRTAEVFRLRELVLPLLQCSEAAEFRKLAVSAQQWQPLTECPVPQLPQWIKRQQQAGIAVVALTRHDRATSLPSFAFPQQTAILLGRELTGIPEKLMEQCDRIVEIPQLGHVDSLNVSTAAAIAAYAYVSQHGITELP